ncbi:MAG: hypothetical protein NZ959_02210 [Armatimonadetes bacterium]|nr:hypothetical protein [Armatimonadota bacterium]MDW8121012.1 type II secretion system protein GspJ [Armatimonadota bacterium]
MKRVRNSTSAFTLTELVVSLVLLVFLALSVHGLVRLVGQAQNQVDRISQVHQVARVVLQSLSSELSSTFPLTVPQEGTVSLGDEAGEQTDAVLLTFYHEDSQDAEGRWDRDTIRFTTVASDPRTASVRRSEIVEVVYYLDDDPQTEETGLVKRIGSHPGLTTEESPRRSELVQEISRQVVSFNVRMFDQEQQVWLDEWEKTDVLPSSLEITIGVVQASEDEPLARSGGHTGTEQIEWFTVTIPLIVTTFRAPSAPPRQEQPSAPTSDESFAADGFPSSPTDAPSSAGQRPGGVRP